MKLPFKLGSRLAVLLVGGIGLTGCHVPSDIACEYFNRPGWDLIRHRWDGDEYQCTAIRLDPVSGLYVLDQYEVREPPPFWRRVG